MKTKKMTTAAPAPTVTTSTTFRQFVVASGRSWPVKVSDPDYKTVVDAFSAAKKAAIANGPTTINEPTPKPTKAARKAAKADNKKKAAKAQAKAEAPDLSDQEIEAIEAEVRSKTVRPCGCGCGAETRASFLPGHDAKLRSRLMTEARTRKASKRAA